MQPNSKQRIGKQAVLEKTFSVTSLQSCYKEVVGGQDVSAE
jgi:hypothetical protein